MSRKLYVGNLPYTIGEKELQELFGQAGRVESVHVVRDPATGRARGFAFVEMATDEEASKATKFFETRSIARPFGQPQPTVGVDVEVFNDTCRVEFDGPLTPELVTEAIGPYLTAVEGLQHVIDDIQGRPKSQVLITAMTGSGTAFGSRPSSTRSRNTSKSQTKSVDIN